MTAARTIVDFLLEADDDLEAMIKEVTIANPFSTMKEVKDWLKGALPLLGFKYQEMGTRGWKKTVQNRQVSVGLSAYPGQALMVLYRRTPADRWQNEEMKSVDCGIPLLMQLMDWNMIR